MTPDSNLQATLRNLATLIAGYLITHGKVSSSYEQLVIGIIVAILSLLWSLWTKYKVTQHIDTALSLPAGSTREVLETAIKDASTKTSDTRPAM